MADEAEVKLRPDSVLATYLEATRAWNKTKPCCMLREPVAGESDFSGPIVASFEHYGDSTVLQIVKQAAMTGWLARLELAEAERLRVWLNEVMG